MATVICCRFDVEVNWVGDLTAPQLVEHFMNEKKYHPNRYLFICYNLRFILVCTYLTNTF